HVRRTEVHDPAPARIDVDCRRARRRGCSVRIAALLSAFAIGAVCVAHGEATAFVDVLDTPALSSPLASKSLLQAVTRAGDRLVAVGQRGHIVVSRDGGATWKQSPAPVSSDLTAVYFVDDRRGWTVGHDGVVLHSEDGGDTWRVQFDGRKASALIVAS